MIDQLIDWSNISLWLSLPSVNRLMNSYFGHSHVIPFTHLIISYHLSTAHCSGVAYVS